MQCQKFKILNFGIYLTLGPAMAGLEFGFEKVYFGGGSMDNFEPRIIGFYCNWSSQMGIDSAGVEGASYPPNLRLIRVMCSGSVDPEVIIEAFKKGLTES